MSHVSGHRPVHFPKLAAAARALAGSPKAKLGLDLLRALGSDAFARRADTGRSPDLKGGVPNPLSRLLRLLNGAGSDIKTTPEFMKRLGEFFEGKRSIKLGGEVILPTLKNRVMVAHKMAEALKAQLSTSKNASTSLDALKKDTGLTNEQKNLLASIKDPSERAQVAAQMKLYNAQNGSPLVLNPASVSLTNEQNQLLSKIKDPSERAMMAAQMKVSNAIKAHEADIALAELQLQPANPNAKDTGLTAEQKDLLSKVKDPQQRAQMEAQMKAFNAKFGSPVADPSARQLSADEQKLLSTITDPTARAMMQAQFVLQHAVEAHKAKSTQTQPTPGPWHTPGGSGPFVPTTGTGASTSAPSTSSGSIIGQIGAAAFNTGLTEDQEKLLKSVKDPAQEAQMRAQFQLQNYQNLMQFISNIMRIMGDISKSIVGNIR